MPDHADSEPPPQRVLVLGTDRLARAVAEELALRGIEMVRPGDGVELDRLDAAILCDNDDVSNLAQALDLRDAAPHLRIVLRSFNTAIGERLPDVLGDCVAMSATSLAAAPFCDLAVGPRGSDEVVADRRRDPFGTLRSSHMAAVLRQLRRRPLFRWMLVALLVLVVVEALLSAALQGGGVLAAVHAGLAAAVGAGAIDMGLSGPRLAEEAAWLQLAAVAAVVLDLFVVGVLFALVTDALVGERIAREFGGSARRHDGHVVIAGLGTVGFRVAAELLARGHRVAAIEADPSGAFLAAARRLGVYVEIADVRQPDALLALGIERADALMALTDDDAANLEAALTAQALAPGIRIVLRIFDPDIAARLDRIPAIAASRSVSRLAAPRFVEAALDQPPAAAVAPA
ncbi:MAG: TrkA-N domain protein [Thermoleophilia bacterium]|nr:TrkA-N domain protein [Thermoleophilia bacterium]